MPTYLRGVAGAPGLALGPLVHLPPPSPPAEAPADEPAAEALARLASAQAAAAAQLRGLAAQLRTEGRTAEAGIFDAHALLAEDTTLAEQVAELVEAGQPLGAALDTTIAQMRAVLAGLDDAYLRTRAADMDAVGQALQAELAGRRPPPELPPGAILVAPDLTPAQTAGLRGGTVAGFATAQGGPTGHTTILARALGIPAVVGLGPRLLDLPDGISLILDGDTHQLISDPAEPELADYTRRLALRDRQRAQRQVLRDQPGRLADGTPLALWANIGHPDDITAAREAGAEGIGLFRTEFLFFERSAPPDEDEQYAIYRSALERMAGRTVVIRTLDIGGDKFPPYLDLPYERNPFLGVRGLRLCMEQPALFGTQLRALLRAAQHGPLWIMLPMVATPADLAWGRAQLQAAAEALAAAGQPHRADPPLGVMIETPAAAMTADLLARKAAFFSVGSNDLTQYTLAAGRDIAALATRYPPDQPGPAVLRLIARASAAARAAGIPIGLCGNLAGVPQAAPLLAGLGLHELSMAPADIPAIKELLLQWSLPEAQAAAQRALEPSE